MSAQSLTDLPARLDSLETAREHVVSRALAPSATGSVGLELEFHVVDRHRPAARVEWSRLMTVLDRVPALDGGSRVTTRHEATDHSWSGKRIALEALVITWLQGLK